MQEIISDIIKSYKGHPSVRKIESKFDTPNILEAEKFNFEPVNENQIKRYLKNLDVNKAVGIDQIPPKLVKLSADFLTPLLTTAINTSIKLNIFSDSAKIASVVPLDKGKPNKNEISSFRPFRPIKCFFKNL